MEELLELYASEEPPERESVWCFDERPCVLQDDVIAPLPMKPGSPKREDYTYQRNGSAALLMAYNIHTGERFAEIRAHRTAVDYAEFVDALRKHCADDTTIHLIEDNLNTHKNGSFYSAFNAEHARELATTIVHHYTPKHASWLNMVELEFSVLTQQCLDRRIGSIEKLRDEIMAWVQERNQSGVRVQWQFTMPKAREKFNRTYHRICAGNHLRLTDDWKLSI